MPSFDQKPSSGPRMPVVSIVHGGGPCFWFTPPPPLKPDAWNFLAAHLGGLLDRMPARPKAILVVTAHWETAVPTFSVQERPGMLYDYNGFPKHTYELQFPAPGAPALAERARALLQQHGIASAADAARGFDHGVFVPMLKILPDADLPVLQMSICADLDPDRHIRIGRALSALRDEGVLIIASGLSYHNLRRFLDVDPRGATQWNDWLVETVTNADPERRDTGLRDWTHAPNARDAHPREDHLIPLMVAAGAAGADLGVQIYRDQVAEKPFSGFQFG